MTEQKPLSVYLDDPQADNWIWKYQEDVDEWWFFADGYEPVNSIKVTRRYGSPLPLMRRGTTMPRQVREVVMRSGLTLFGKSIVGIVKVGIDKAVVIKMADEVLLYG